MTQKIQRELLFPQQREQVWRAIANSSQLAAWIPHLFQSIVK